MASSITRASRPTVPSLILLSGLPSSLHHKEGLYARQAGQINGQPVWRSLSLSSKDAWIVYSPGNRWMVCHSPEEGSKGTGWATSANDEYDIIKPPKGIDVGWSTVAVLSSAAVGLGVRDMAMAGAAALAALDPPLWLAAYLSPLAAQLPLLAGGVSAVVIGSKAAAVAVLPSERVVRLPCDSVHWQTAVSRSWHPAPSLSARRVVSPADGYMHIPKLLLSTNGATLSKEAVRALLGSYVPVLTPAGPVRLVNEMYACTSSSTQD